MTEIKAMLEKITRVWNNYFLNFEFLQNQINYTEEVRTNYFGDILSYFNDTLELLTQRSQKDDYKSVLFHSTGLLQIIYVQQDLIDELLYIFKVEQGLQEDKEPNRSIRNELVGHPIRRKDGGKGEFISSAFYSYDLDPENIHYILYQKENGFTGLDKIYRVQDILSMHQIFLNKYLNTVLIAPLTHKLKGYPSRVASRFAGREVEIVLDQIRAVDKLRLKIKQRKLDPGTAANVKKVLITMFS